MTRQGRAWWWTALTSVLAADYVVIAVVSPQPAVRWPALAGAIVILAALWFASHHRWIALAAVVVGALVPVLTTWWSLVVPFTAVLIIACGTLAVRGAADRARRRPQLST